MNLIKKETITKITQTVGKATLTAKKHSPLALTVMGGVGLIATAYFAYKAQPRIAEIVDDMEAQRELIDRYMSLKQVPVSRLRDEEVIFLVEAEKNGVPTFNRFEYMKQITGAIALPVMTGVASLFAISFSYRIMNNRVSGLATALSTVMAQKLEQEQRIKQHTTEDQYKAITGPAVIGDIEGQDAAGNKKVVKGVVERAHKSLQGVWFSDSQEFFKDDHHYNKEFLYNSELRLDAKLCRSGHLFLNEVYDELNLPRTKEGALMGWSVGDSFGFSLDVHDTTDQQGCFYKDIYINWVRPRYIYEDVDFIGRYGSFA